MSYGVIFSLIAVFLLEHGFSDGSVGIVIAPACLLSALLQPAAAAATDRGARLSSP